MESGIIELKLPSPAEQHPVRTEIARTWHLVRNLVARNLKVKYQRSVLGFVWTLLNPLLMAATLTAVFGSIIRMPIENYWAFLLSGFFAWNFIQQTISSGTFVLAQHVSMIKGSRIRSEALVLGTVLARAVEFTIELSLVLVAVVFLHHDTVPMSFVFIPLLILLQIVFALGIVLPIAAISVFFDDVQHSLAPLLLVLFYISPVFYPVSLVAENVRPLYAWNPVARLLQLWHTVVYEGVRPPPGELLVFAGIAFGACALGLLIFARHKRHFAEVL